MQIPSQIIAGDSLAWREVALRDNLGQSVDSGAYQLQFSFRGPAAGGNLDLVGAPAGTGWEFALTSGQTAAFNNTPAPLTWFWHAIATKAGGVRITAGEGTLHVRPNVAGQATGAAFDGRSQAEKDLEAVQAEIRARTSGGLTIEYSIGTRSLKKEPMSALIELEQRCKRIVARERRAQMLANGLGNPGRVGVRFK